MSNVPYRSQKNFSLMHGRVVAKLEKFNAVKEK
jgi:hypothetical protein